MYLSRHIEGNIIKDLEHVEVVALLGSIQCGKSTLIKHLLKEYPESENPA